MYNSFLLAFLFLNLISCKPSGKLEHKSFKSPDSNTSSAADHSLGNGSGGGLGDFRFPDETIGPEEEIPMSAENIDLGESIDKVDLDPRCKDFSSESASKCSSHQNAVEWKVARMSGDCEKYQVEFWCYEAKSGDKSYRGSFTSYCTGFGKGEESYAADRPTQNYLINWYIPTKEYTDSTWTSSQQIFTLSCE